MTPTVGDILDELGRLAPWDLAEEWDNSGLQVGERGAAVSLAVVALDAGPREVAFAREREAGLLLTHHPLFFRPPAALDTAGPVGGVVRDAVRGGMAVIAAHTNLDVAAGGLADVLARRLGLENVRPLVPPDRDGYLKLVTYVPEASAEAVAEALVSAGAGRIGRYAGCFFAVQGVGSFEPLPGAEPAIGAVGRREKVPEVRLETRIPTRRRAEFAALLRRCHPYEEPVADFHPLRGPEEGVGLGRVGNRRAVPEELVRTVKDALGTPVVRVVGKAPRVVERIAALPGSGGDHLDAVIAAGADTYVTGEIRYHQALEAEWRGIWVVETGHGVSEAPAVPLLREYLNEASRRRGWNLEVVAYEPVGSIHRPL